MNFKVYSIGTKVENINITSIYPFSENYKAVHLEDRKQMDDLSLEEKRELIMENLLVERISRQVAFSELVNVGDVVYKISFDYLLHSYNVFVICSHES